jgi:hypothetical protein
MSNSDDFAEAFKEKQWQRDNPQYPGGWSWGEWKEISWGIREFHEEADADFILLRTIATRSS